MIWHVFTCAPFHLLFGGLVLLCCLSFELMSMSHSADNCLSCLGWCSIFGYLVFVVYVDVLLELFFGVASCAVSLVVNYSVKLRRFLGTKHVRDRSETHLHYCSAQIVLIQPAFGWAELQQLSNIYELKGSKFKYHRCPNFTCHLFTFNY